MNSTVLLIERVSKVSQTGQIFGTGHKLGVASGPIVDCTMVRILGPVIILVLADRSDRDHWKSSSSMPIRVVLMGRRGGTFQFCSSFLYAFQTLTSVIVRHFFRYPLLNLNVLLQKSITRLTPPSDDVCLVSQ